MEENQGGTSYVPQTKAFWKGWVLDHWRYKNPSEGYDSEGNYHSSGGYWYQAKRLRDLFIEGPYDFGSLKMVRVNRSNNKVVSPNGEHRFLVDLIAEGTDKMAACPVEKRRTEHIVKGVDTGFYTYEDWIQREGDWHPALFEPRDGLPSIR